MVSSQRISIPDGMIELQLHGEFLTGWESVGTVHIRRSSIQAALLDVTDTFGDRVTCADGEPACVLLLSDGTRPVVAPNQIIDLIFDQNVNCNVSFYHKDEESDVLYATYCLIQNDVIMYYTDKYCITDGGYVIEWNN